MAPQNGTTTPDGYIDTQVPTTTTRVTLHVKIGDGQVDIDLPVDTLLHLGDDRGVQQRLRNLGVPCAAADGTWDAAANAVVRRFRSGASLPPDDGVDDALRRRLFDLHDRG